MGTVSLLAGTDNARGVAACASWFAFRVRANHERAVVLRAEDARFLVYSPERSERVRWSDRTKETRRPLFPGYIFARCAPLDLRLLANLPGVVQALPNNLTPGAISDADIETVRQLESSGLPISAATRAPGDVVRIKRGPLAGVEGVLQRAGRVRLVVTIESFGGRAVSVDLDASCLL